VIDRWFEKISEGMTDSQKADLKRKFSRMDALAKTQRGSLRPFGEASACP
jgi:type I restriction enzyme R subunit